jgi:hypothetical protein
VRSTDPLDELVDDAVPELLPSLAHATAKSTKTASFRAFTGCSLLWFDRDTKAKYERPRRVTTDVR